MTISDFSISNFDALESLEGIFRIAEKLTKIVVSNACINQSVIESNYAQGIRANSIFCPYCSPQKSKNKHN